MKTRLAYILFLSIAFCSLIASCSKEEPYVPEKKPGKEYFPLITGNSIIYKITQIVIDSPSQIFDTAIYFLKERVDEPFVDNEGDTAYRIEVFRKFNIEDDWIIHKVWSSKLTKNSAEKDEDNYRIVKIIFPIKKDLSWDGNIYNEQAASDTIFTITAVNQKYTNANMNPEINIDSCITVTQYYSESLIDKINIVEAFAPNIGLIYKEKSYIYSQTYIPGVPIEKIARTASIYIQEIIDTLQNE